MALGTADAKRRRRQGAGLQHVGAQPAGQHRPGPQELVEHQGPPDVAVQRVLGGEPDAGQHLLASAACQVIFGPAGGQHGDTPQKPGGTAPAATTVSAMTMTASSAAGSGRRFTHLTTRSATPTGLARIGSPSRKRRRSSARSAALA